jgi:aspartate/methionine/tyrosine aminotransferase
MRHDYLNVGGRSWEELAQDSHVIHMGHNCNHLELDPAIHTAMISAIEEDEYRNYTPPYGFEELQALMKEDVGCDNVEVMVTQGATEAIFQGMSTILQPGDQVILTDPGWPHIGAFARQLGAEVIEVPIYPRQMDGKLTDVLVRPHLTPRTKLIAIIDPHNPLGTSYTEAEIKAMCALVEQHDAYLLHDATYRDFAIDGHFPAIRYSERAFMNISLSKICGFAGLRVGATLTNPGLLRKIRDRQISRLGGNWLAQRGAIAAYKTKKSWRPRVIETCRRNQRVLNECIAKLDGLRVLVYPSSGNFLAVDVTRTGRSASEFVSAALDGGFVVRSGGYTSPRFGDQFVRITTTVPPAHIDLLCEAMPKIVTQLLSRPLSENARV